MRRRYLNESIDDLLTNPELPNSQIVGTLPYADYMAYRDRTTRYNNIRERFKDKDKLVRDFIKEQEALAPDHTPKAEMRRLGLTLDEDIFA